MDGEAERPAAIGNGVASLTEKKITLNFYLFSWCFIQVYVYLLALSYVLKIKRILPFFRFTKKWLLDDQT